MSQLSSRDEIPSTKPSALHDTALPASFDLQTVLRYVGSHSLSFLALLKIRQARVGTPAATLDWQPVLLTNGSSLIEAINHFGRSSLSI